MEQRLIIDRIVEHSTELIATLATLGGTRASLEGVTEQFFWHLGTALESRGIGRKIVAESFGLRLRSYQKKMKRLDGERGKNGSLWEDIYRWLSNRGLVSRGEVLAAFHQHDPSTSGAILNDLVESGLAFRTGKGTALRFGLLPDSPTLDAESPTLVRELVLVSVMTRAPVMLEDLVAEVPISRKAVEEAVTALHEEGRLLVHADGTLAAVELEEDAPSPVGWQGAVLSHLESMFSTLQTLILQKEAGLEKKPHEGITTAYLPFDEDNEQYREVTQMLRDTIQQLRTLSISTERVFEEDRKRMPTRRVVVYMGLAELDV